MIGLPYGEKTVTIMLSRFHLIPERHGRTDRRTDRIAISILRVNVLTRDKNKAVLDCLQLSNTKTRDDEKVTSFPNTAF